MADTDMTIMQPKDDTNEVQMSTPGIRTRRVYVGNLSWDADKQDLDNHMRKCGDVVHINIFEDGVGRSKGCAIVEYSSPAAAERAMVELTNTELRCRRIFVREDREWGKGNRGGSGNGSGAGSRAGGSGERRPPPDRQHGGYRNRDYDGQHGNYNREDRYNRGGNRNNSGGGGGGGHYPPHRYGGSNSGGKPNPRPRIREDESDRTLFIANLSYKTSWQELKDLFGKFGRVIRADILYHPDGRSKGMGNVIFEDPAIAEAAINDMNGYLHEGRQLTVRLNK